MGRIEEQAAQAEKHELSGHRMRVAKKLVNVLRLKQEDVSRLWNTLPYSELEAGWIYEEDGLQFLGRVEENEKGDLVPRVYYLRGRYRNLFGQSAGPGYLLFTEGDDSPEPFTDFRALQKQFRKEDSAAARQNFTSGALVVIFVVFCALSLIAYSGGPNFAAALAINGVFALIVVGVLVDVFRLRVSSARPARIAEQAAEADAR